MEVAAPGRIIKHLPTLPGDDARRIMWGFADRHDLQLLVRYARSLACGPAARLVALGARDSYERTPEAQDLLRACNNAGIAGLFNEPPHSGSTEGPRNLARALVAFELAAGAATNILIPHDCGGIMAAARLLSAVEPLIRYQRGRFQGRSPAGPGSPSYILGLQIKEDVVHRLLEHRFFRDNHPHARLFRLPLPFHCRACSPFHGR